MDKLFGKLYGDKDYISKNLLKDLFHQGVHLVTKFRKNMRTKMITPLTDVILLDIRAICETIIDQLKISYRLNTPGIVVPKTF